MTKNTIKKAMPILLGTLIVSSVASIIPNNFMVEASKENQKNKQTIVRETSGTDKNHKYIDLEEAMDIAVKKVNKKNSKVTDHEVSLTYNDPHYMIEITTTNNDKVSKVYKVKVDGVTGKVLNTYVEKAKDNKKNTSPVKANITKEEATKKALEEIGKDATLDKVELKNRDNTPIYEVKMYDKDYKYQVRLHGATGQILRYTKEIIKDTSVVDVKYITKEEAIKKALEKIGRDAKLDEIEFEKNNNPPKYEIEMYNKDYEYEIEVHAITGAILEFERDDD